MEQEPLQEPVQTGKKGNKVIAIVLVIVLLLVGGGFLGFKYAFVPYVANGYVDAYDEQSEAYTKILDEMEEIDDKLDLEALATEEDFASAEKDINRFLELTKELDKEIQDSKDAGKAPYTAGALDDVEDASDEFTDELEKTNTLYKEGYEYYQDLLPIIKEMTTVSQALNTDAEPDYTDPNVLQQSITELETLLTQVQGISQKLEAIKIYNDDINNFTDSQIKVLSVLENYLQESIKGLKDMQTGFANGTLTQESLAVIDQQATAAEAKFQEAFDQATQVSDGLMSAILQDYTDQKEILRKASNKSDEERNKVVDEYDLDQEKVELE